MDFFFLDYLFRGSDTPQPASLSTVLSPGAGEAGQSRDR